jgi:hypothetical protein
MKTKTLCSLAIAATVTPLVPNVRARVSQQTLDAISAPEKVETRLGTLEYKDGVPTSATVQKAYDNLDFMHAVCRWIDYRLLRPHAACRNAAGNWIQTVPGKGWNTILRLYSPLEPFFLKTWRPSEIELVK